MNRIHDFHPELPSFVLGGGGITGIGYIAGIMAAFKDHGADLSDAQMLGTSAGSWAAGFVAEGLEFEDVEAMGQIKFPDSLRPGYLHDIAYDIFGDNQDSNVSAMAFRIASVSRANKLGSAVLEGRDYKLADMVSASSAVPGVFLPTRIGGNLYVDGGVHSIVSADMAPGARHVIAVAPMAQHFMPPLGGYLEKKLRDEQEIWRHENSGDITYIRPNREIAKFVRNPKDAFSCEIGKRIYWLAREQGDKLINDPNRNLGEIVREIRKIND